MSVQASQHLLCSHTLKTVFNAKFEIAGLLGNISKITQIERCVFFSARGVFCLVEGKKLFDQFTLSVGKLSRLHHGALYNTSCVAALYSTVRISALQDYSATNAYKTMWLGTA